MNVNTSVGIVVTSIILIKYWFDQLIKQVGNMIQLSGFDVEFELENVIDELLHGRKRRGIIVIVVIVVAVILKYNGHNNLPIFESPNLCFLSPKLFELV